MVCCPGCAVRFWVTRWLNAATCAAAFGPVDVTAASTATNCSWVRMACSLARAPYCTVTDWSIRAIDDARAELAPFSPVYHCTVFAAVPLVSTVAVANGDVPTRSGG